jgi:hypothetical protein
MGFVIVVRNTQKTSIRSSAQTRRKQMIQFLAANWKDIAEAIAAIIGVASIIVKLTPTLKDDSILLVIIKFIGKWIALDKYGPSERPK